MKRTTFLLGLFTATLISVNSAIPKQAEEYFAMKCLSVNIYHEAKGEPHLGKMAVAYVTMNRVHDKTFPNNVCDVVKQRHQFSWYWDGRSDKIRDYDAYIKSLDAAMVALYEYGTEVHNDPTKGAMWYHSIRMKRYPKWAKKFKRVAQIGNHVFYRNK